MVIKSFFDKLLLRFQSATPIKCGETDGAWNLSLISAALLVSVYMSGPTETTEKLNIFSYFLVPYITS